MLVGAGRLAMRHVASRHHPLVATCRAIARGKDAGARLLLDGPHLVTEALASGVTIETAVLDDALAASEEGTRILDALASSGVETLTASRTVIEAMSPVSTPSGLVAIAVPPVVGLGRALAGHEPLVVVGVDVQDPGNVGAIVRAAEAGGATGAVFCGACADPLGWKALRGSMGSALRLPLARVASVAEAVATARAQGVRVVATVARGGEPFHEHDYTRPTAFLLGGEGPGLGPEAVAAADAVVAIPMTPDVESLNVAVAAALLVYEARRQRTRRSTP
jgi:TrmH family RNA methyltransferase